VSDIAELRAESERLAHDVADLMTKRNLTLAVAESFTGGLVSHVLTNVPGSSKFFIAGLCVYNPNAKIDLLGVPRELIDKYGVASAEVAEAMAARVRELCRSDIGLGTTGFAGPASEGDTLPPGTFFIAISTPTSTKSHRFHYEAPRLAVKFHGAFESLSLLLS